MPIRYKTSELIPGTKEWKHTWHTAKGKFVGWDTGGAFNFTYARIEGKRSVLFIPIHDLDPEDQARMLKERPIKKETE